MKRPTYSGPSEPGSTRRTMPEPPTGFVEKRLRRIGDRVLLDVTDAVSGADGISASISAKLGDELIDASRDVVDAYRKLGEAIDKLEELVGRP